MKHNPRLNEKMARLPGFADVHPLQPVSTAQGALEVIQALSSALLTMTGYSSQQLLSKTLGELTHPDDVLNDAEQLRRLLAGEIAAKSVAITGCGPIGLFSIAVAKAVGATSVFAIEVNEHRARIAREMKADYVLNPAKEDVHAIVMDKTGGLGVVNGASPA